MKRPRQRGGFTLVELIVVLAIVGVLMALLLSAVLKAREAANRARCANHLRQVGLALHLYHDSHGCFPPGATWKPWRHRWLTFLLPYLEQQPLAARYRWQMDWCDERNREAVTVPFELVQCPSAPENRVDLGTPTGPDVPVACSDYAAVDSVQTQLVETGLVAAPLNAYGVLSVRSRTRLTDITDGASGTLVITEAAGRPLAWKAGHANGGRGLLGGGWADPANFIRIWGSSSGGTVHPGPCAINCTNEEVYSFHPGGANGAFADGSIRFLSSTMDIATLAALATPAGGEIVSATEFP